MLKRIVSYFHTLTLYPAARAMVTFQSERQRFKTMGQQPKVHFEASYEGQRIMLLALYEKGQLRPDVIRLIETARAEGLYVLAVNTLKLSNPSMFEGMIDCYIERPNFGRDFGSYKTGFLHVFKNNWHETCQRLLMINDSIFFSSERMPKFLNDMMNSDIEVLGSTENYDMEYHLGSFCIAIAQSVLKQPSFQKYWHSYRLTDVRPRVIKRGELKLSKVLKSCVSKHSAFNALYSASRFSSAIAADDNLLSFAITSVRTSTIFAWKRASLKNVADEYRDRFAVPKLEMEKSPKSIEIAVKEYFDEVHVQTYSELKEFLKSRLSTNNISDEHLRRIMHAEFLESFMSGSQIHQNASILIRLGLPIIKLDGLYRGIFSYEDMARICEMLKDDEGHELGALLISRPYGGRYLTGWKRAAFEAGLL
ncbi:lipopolysaccharide biosynthesis protein [Litoreibacter arenae]|uniref:Lipopolysaccharide biosynthesis protein n=1 Tax=Litoreibacter arenae DSM 19593 TaxID=1123360 RepID=S9QG33_9RHOB|nr:lipopolysaccharide biosynthesis protein [Litoreibacter arenae]EPX78538.1 Lipopolysaccharide biosynthesis protein [Litoreibacter arenae DSM 19593]